VFLFLFFSFSVSIPFHLPIIPSFL
jgi:hypothetical protein